MKPWEENCVVLCECQSLDHIFQLRSFIDEPKEVYLEVHLAQYRSFWSRLWYGLKYAFGYKCRYGSTDSVLLTKEDAQRMINVLTKYCND